MSIWLTSDTHFNHANILKYEPETRPFASIKEMNETIIQNWNRVIKDNDTVYVLGDFFMGPLQEIEPILNRLSGKIILVRGNHDTDSRVKFYREKGIEVQDIAYLRYKGRFFVMCHFPIANEEFIKMVRNDNSEVVMAYGHLHSNAPKGYIDGTYHIGMDGNGLTPINIQEVWDACWPEEQMTEEVKAYKAAHENDKM